jgi:hypothetical protein
MPHSPLSLHDDASEIRKLVNLVAADWPQHERAEALAVALADPVDALTCWRALADEHRTVGTCPASAES